MSGGASPFARSYKGESILYYLRSGVQDEILFRNACDILAKGYDRILRAMYDSCGTALEKASLKRQMETEMKAAIDAGGLLSLTDDRGRTILVNAAKISYVEIGASSSRRVGFGS